MQKLKLSLQYKLITILLYTEKTGMMETVLKC